MSELANYSRELESQGKFDEAITYLLMDVEQKTSAYDVRMDIGRILNKQRKYDDALKSFDLVLSMNENHAECWFGKGIAYMGLFEWVEAYHSFFNALKIDENNPNSLFYLAIILRDFGFEEDSEVYFKDFKELDNEFFKLERECYQFGLIFQQNLNELVGFKKRINIDAFKYELLSLNVSHKDVNYYLHCLPYEELVEKILSLKQSKYEVDVKNIIYSELKQLGLDDVTISKMFEVETLDNLKDKIISQKGFDPFPTLKKELDISYYVKTGLDAYVDKYIKKGYTSIPDVSKYNLLREIKVSNYRATNIHINQERKIISLFSHENRDEANQYFYYGKKLILNGNMRGLLYLDNALNSCPKYDYGLKFNIKFYYATALSKFGYVKRAIKYYMELKDSINGFEKLDSFLFNLGNICYDLGYYRDAEFYYEKFLKKNPDCEVVKILKNNAKNMYTIDLRVD